MLRNFIKSCNGQEDNEPTTISPNLFSFNLESNKNNQNNLFCIHQRKLFNDYEEMNVGEYIPTVVDIYTSDFKLNDDDYVLSITDLSGNRNDLKMLQIINGFYSLKRVFI